jgi:DNA-binding beta-propeller fold protein YncE
MSMNTIASAIRIGIVVSLAAAFGIAHDPLVASDRPIEGERLHTGMKITPTAAQGSVFQALNPDLPGLPEFTAGQAVATALSPDGSTLLVLTSGYNRNNGPTGSRVAAWSNEYVFVYDVTGRTPAKTQSLTLPNTFNGITWRPDGQAFYVSGGRDDNVHFFTKIGGAWAESMPALDLGNHPNVSGYYQPMAAGMAVNSTGTRLVVANMLYDSVTIVDLASRTLIGEVDLRPGVADPSKAGTPGGSYPFWVVIKGEDKAYVSSQRDREIVIVSLAGSPQVTGRIPVGGLPGKMVLNASQDLLFVAESNSDSLAIIDTNSDRVLTRIGATAPKSLLAKARTFKGGNPNSLALSPSERTLYVTNGGTNSVAVISLRSGHDDDDDDAAGDEEKRRDSGRGSRISGTVTGLIPTGYYPNSVSVSADGRTLFVANGMSNTGPNPDACRDTLSIAPGSQNACSSANQYSWQLTKAGLLSVPVPSSRQLDTLTDQVAYNNRMKWTHDEWRNAATMAAVRRHMKHVIYIVKENRTYDQVYGDLPRGNGDPSLAIMSPFSPNHQKATMDFVLFDNFHDSGTVSGDGWNWSTAGRSNDYTQKSVPVNYGGRGFSYDWEGANRNVNVSLPGLAERQAQNPAYPNDPNLLAGVGDVAAPDSPKGEAGTGYLWDSALRAGLTVRNYGFFVANLPTPTDTFRTPFALGVPQSAPLNRALAPHTDLYFRGYDQTNADYWLFKEWEREFDGYVANNNLPNLMFVRFPHDHFGNFSTAIDGVNTVETQMADNDYAVGLLLEKVARSPYRDNTLIFVVEDDAQNGGDHVDAHRSIALVAGSVVKRGELVSTHYTTVSMIRTIADVLGIQSSGLNDALAEPMTDLFMRRPQPWSYTAIVPSVLYSTALPLPAPGVANRQRTLPDGSAPPEKPMRTADYWARAMDGQNFTREDDLDPERFNQALWTGLRGEGVPYPHVRHGKDLRVNRKELLKQYSQQRSMQ